MYWTPRDVEEEALRIEMRKGMANLIRIAMELSGTSVAAVAQELGVTDSYVSKLRWGRQNIGFARLAYIAQICGFKLVIDLKPITSASAEPSSPDPSLPARPAASRDLGASFPQ